MARVPTASGFQVAPTVPQYQSPDIVQGGDSLLEKNAQAVEKSSSRLSQAVNDAYVRYSDMRVTDQVNQVNTQIKDLLYGQDGALSKQGGDVVHADKERSFGDIYMEKINKIVDEAGKGLDPSQAAAFKRKAADSVLKAQNSLLTHQMKQTEAYRAAAYQTRAANAADSIVINGTDLEGIQESIKTIIESSDSINEHYDPETRKRLSKNATSKALSNSIATQLQIGNVGAAKAILERFGKDMNGIDSFNARGKIDKAEQQAKSISVQKQMAGSLSEQIKPQSIMYDSAASLGIKTTKEDVESAYANSKTNSMAEVAVRIIKGNEEFDRILSIYEGNKKYIAGGAKTAGMVKAGNIDISKINPVKNGDSYSTVLSMSINVDGKEVLIPRVVDGKILSEQEAKANFEKTGKHLGVFNTAKEATAYADKLHKFHEGLLKGAEQGTTNISDMLRSVLPEEEANKLIKDANALISKQQELEQSWKNPGLSGISEFLASKFPDASEEEIATVATSFTTKLNRIHKVAQANANAQSKEAFSAIQNGATIEAVRNMQMPNVSAATKDGLVKFTQKRAQGTLVTDATVFDSYYYNPERLKSESAENLYAIAWKFSEADFDKLMKRKDELDQGKQFTITKESLIRNAVTYALTEAGYDRSKESKFKQRVYDEVRSQIVSMIFQEVNDERNGSMLSPDEVTQRVRTALATQYRIKEGGMGISFSNEKKLIAWSDKEGTVGELANGSISMSTELTNMMGMSIRAGGEVVTAPDKYDMTNELLKFMVRGDLSGFTPQKIEAMYNAEQINDPSADAKVAKKLGRKPTHEEVVLWALKTYVERI